MINNKIKIDGNNVFEFFLKLFKNSLKNNYDRRKVKNFSLMSIFN
jgi:hypothetical protein